MYRQPNRTMNATRVLLALAAFLLILLAWWFVFAAQSGLSTRRLVQDNLPMQFIYPTNGDELPGVIIAHGFGGSRQLMLGYGHVLAHAGFGVLLLDFPGHGANATSFSRNNGDSLQQAVATARAVLIQQPEVAPGEVALLGHSMGSGAVMQAAIAHEVDYDATVAISPTDAPVTAVSPRNLLLQAGQFEPGFISRAQTLMEQAGGENTDFATGTARLFVLVPNVEHITILFSPVSHAAAREWLERVFGAQRASSYQDTRMVWYLVHLGAWLVLLTAVSPLLPHDEPSSRSRRRPLHWVGLLVAPPLASGILLLLEQFIRTDNLANILVGSTLGVWFFVFGAIWLLVGFRPPRLTFSGVFWGLLLFGLLWFAFGALAQFVWLPWLLIPARLLRWPALAATAFPWLLAAGTAQAGGTFWQRLGWWLWQTLLIGGGIFLLINLVPGLGILMLILPLFPVVFAILALANAAIDKPWAYAIGGSLFFGWMLLAYFPLTG